MLARFLHAPIISKNNKKENNRCKRAVVV
jgi:hypothetical protein